VVEQESRSQTDQDTDHDVASHDANQSNAASRAAFGSWRRLGRQFVSLSVFTVTLVKSKDQRTHALDLPQRGDEREDRLSGKRRAMWYTALDKSSK
jgi:hypothetical protein